MGISRRTDKTEGSRRRWTVQQRVPHQFRAFRSGLFKGKSLKERKLFLTLAGQNQAAGAQSIVKPFGVAAEVSAPTKGKLLIGLSTGTSRSDHTKTAVARKLLIAGIGNVLRKLQKIRFEWNGLRQAIFEHAKLNAFAVVAASKTRFDFEIAGRMIEN